MPKSKPQNLTGQTVRFTKINLDLPGEPLTPQEESYVGQSGVVNQPQGDAVADYVYEVTFKDGTVIWLTGEELALIN